MKILERFGKEMEEIGKKVMSLTSEEVDRIATPERLDETSRKLFSLPKSEIKDFNVSASVVLMKLFIDAYDSEETISKEELDLFRKREATNSFRNGLESLLLGNCPLMSFAGCLIFDKDWSYTLACLSEDDELTDKIIDILYRLETEFEIKGNELDQYIKYI